METKLIEWVGDNNSVYSEGEDNEVNGNNKEKNSESKINCREIL